MVREEVVRLLVNAGMDGMAQVAEGTTAAEVFSAMMTMSLRGIQTAKERDLDVEQFREGIARLWAELPELPKKEVH